MEFALITGAASGMGRIYALRLSEAGFGVVAVDRDREGLERLRGEVASAGGCPVKAGHDGVAKPAIIPIVQDLSEPDAAAKVRRAFEEAAPDGTVAVLINNAGFIFTTEITATDPAKLQAMMAVHCTTPLLLCREFVPGMKAAGRGYVLNISSVCAWMDWPAIGMYGNTKRFVKGYSRSLRLECRESGVSVTTAIFGAVDTPLFGFSEKTRRWMRRLGLMITPEKAVDKALRGMFRRRARVIPGFGNRLLIPLLPVLGDRLISRAYRKFGKYLR